MTAPHGPPTCAGYFMLVICKRHADKPPAFLIRHGMPCGCEGAYAQPSLPDDTPSEIYACEPGFPE